MWSAGAIRVLAHTPEAAVGRGESARAGVDQPGACIVLQPREQEQAPLRREGSFEFDQDIDGRAVHIGAVLQAEDGHPYRRLSSA